MGHGKKSRTLESNMTKRQNLKVLKILCKVISELELKPRLLGSSLCTSRCFPTDDHVPEHVQLRTISQPTISSNQWGCKPLKKKQNKTKNTAAAYSTSWDPVCTHPRCWNSSLGLITLIAILFPHRCPCPWQGSWY